MTPSEEWRPIPGYPGYEASTAGRVRSVDRVVPAKRSKGQFKRGRIIKLDLRHGGYLYSGVGRERSRLVHRLVALAFLGPCPEGMQCCHNNGIRTDNRIENLRYDTREENARDKVRHGTDPNIRKTHCPAGHPYAGTNLIVTRKGHRLCRACRDAREVIRHAQRRAARAAARLAKEAA